MRDKPKKQSKNFACQMESSIFEKMDKFCKEHRMSKTGFVELAVMEYLAKRESAEVKEHE
jgi:hypothetical protein